MRLLVVRHAIAEDRVAFAATGRDDAERPLTDEGRRRMEQGARGLRQLVPVLDLVATSPLVRAVQTAEIVAAAYDGPVVERVPVLAAGGDPESVVQWLRGRRAGDTVAVVGHEPDCSILVSHLLAGAQDSFVQLKKGSACLLEFADRPAARAGVLRWALAPKQLRLIGGGGA
ncbi:MAG: histidine phosphatase family protein [Gemmatimonadota bacterium]|nr:MAG: histidine phosphatase family protein [Gemmatimonadota bacterium]